MRLPCWPVRDTTPVLVPAAAGSRAWQGASKHLEPRAYLLVCFVAGAHLSSLARELPFVRAQVCMSLPKREPRCNEQETLRTDQWPSAIIKEKWDKGLMLSPPSAP